jgi:putative tryptophan/tyrosine transport system substrate-binding protein
MRRRELVLVLGGTLTLARGLRAQQQKTVPVIGFLNGGSADKFAPYFAAFRNGLGAMGYVDGQSVAIEYRNAEGNYDRLPAFAADLVQRKVSAIATFSLPAVLAAKAATGTIPIVFATGVNPVAAGLIASFNRPGGNLTGISMSDSAMVDKQIEMLHEVAPKTELIGVLVNPTNPFYESILPGLREAANALNIRLSIEHVANQQEIDKAFASVSQSGAGAVFVLADPLFQDRRDQLVALQNRYSLPTVSGGGSSRAWEA